MLSQVSRIWQETVSIFCFAEGSFQTRSACCLSSHMKTYYMMLTCKNSMLLCCMQSFLYLGQFLLASALLTPVLIMETDAWWEGQVMTMLFLLSIDGRILHQFWFASTCMVQLQLNNLTSSKVHYSLATVWLRETEVHTTSHTNLTEVIWLVPCGKSLV